MSAGSTERLIRQLMEVLAGHEREHGDAVRALVLRAWRVEVAVRGSLIQNCGDGEWADVRRDGQRSQLAATIAAMEAALKDGPCDD